MAKFTSWRSLKLRHLRTKWCSLNISSKDITSSSSLKMWWACLFRIEMSKCSHVEASKTYLCSKKSSSLFREYSRSTNFNCKHLSRSFKQGTSFLSTHIRSVVDNISSSIQVSLRCPKRALHQCLLTPLMLLLVPWRLQRDRLRLNN